MHCTQKVYVCTRSLVLYVLLTFVQIYTIGLATHHDWVSTFFYIYYFVSHTDLILKAVQSTFFSLLFHYCSTKVFFLSCSLKCLCEHHVRSAYFFFLFLSTYAAVAIASFICSLSNFIVAFFTKRWTMKMKTLQRKLFKNEL